MGNRVESLGEIQVDNIHHSLHISQAGYFVIEDDQVCQALFAFGELHVSNVSRHLQFNMCTPL